MAERKTERLMNLIFALLVSKQFLTKVQIRDAIADYRDAPSADAFDRMFERDLSLIHISEPTRPY